MCVFAFFPPFVFFTLQIKIYFTANCSAVHTTTHQSRFLLNALAGKYIYRKRRIRKKKQEMEQANTLCHCQAREKKEKCNETFARSLVNLVGVSWLTLQILYTIHNDKNAPK